MTHPSFNEIIDLQRKLRKKQKRLGNYIKDKASDFVNVSRVDVGTDVREFTLHLKSDYIETRKIRELNKQYDQFKATFIVYDNDTLKVSFNKE